MDTLEDLGATAEEAVAPAAPPAAPPPPKTIKVQQFVDLSKLDKDLAFSSADLTAAMIKQSALFVHYGILFAKASHQVNNIKLLLETREAIIYKQLRDAAAVEGTKVTEAGLEKSVSTTPLVRACKKALIEAKQVEDIAKTATEGFRHRRDMLVQQGLLSREEMKGDVSINGPRQREELAADLRERIARKAGALPAEA